jgi:phosphatidylglycerophosphate synthase
MDQRNVTTLSHHPNEWEIDNLPNRLTMLRVILIPIILLSLFFNLSTHPWVIAHIKLLNYTAAWTFVAASITDFFDGYIARKKNIVTIFGSFLDPIAVHVLIVLVLVLREMYITALRLLAMEKGLSVPVGTLGKWKTATQMVGIPLLMANDKPWGFDMPLTGTIAIYLATLFSLYSALEYSTALIKKIQKLRRENKRKRREQKTNLVKE